MIFDQLDIRTLSFATVLYCHILGIGLFVFHKTQLVKNGIGWIGAGLLILGYGFLFISFRHFVGNLISIVIANGLILLGAIVISEGLFRFQEYKGPLQWSGPLLLAVLLLFHFYRFQNQLSYCHRQYLPVRAVYSLFIRAPEKDAFGRADTLCHDHIAINRFRDFLSF